MYLADIFLQTVSNMDVQTVLMLKQVVGLAVLAKLFS